MAESIPSAGLILLAWLVGGLLTLAGALTFAELGAAMPQAGGPYVYLREAYGALPAFLYGWVMFLVYNSGGIAGLTAAFSEYFGVLFPIASRETLLYSTSCSIFDQNVNLSLTAYHLVSVAVILLLSVINYLGVVLGKTVQNIFSSIKIGTLLIIILLGFILGRGTPVELSLKPAGLAFGKLLVGFGVALIAVSWAFDGWNNVNWVAGEIKKPERTLPAALILSTLGITLLYLLANYLYLYALPIQEMTGVVRVAEKATTILFGGPTGTLIAAAVVVSTFSAINGSILAGPRVYFAMARDGLFFESIGRVHPRFHTPGTAIAIQAVWCCLLVLSGTFDQLITFTMFVSIAFWVAATASVFTLRRKRPDMPRPYKTWGYPVVPALFILVSVGILLNTLIERPVEALTGIGLTLLGIPVYVYWKRKIRSPRG
jgi:APA family basic amino acid/polyamine antiporter